MSHINIFVLLEIKYLVLCVESLIFQTQVRFVKKKTKKTMPEPT